MPTCKSIITGFVLKRVANFTILNYFEVHGNIQDPVGSSMDHPRVMGGRRQSFGLFLHKSGDLDFQVLRRIEILIRNSVFKQFYGFRERRSRQQVINEP